MKDLKKIDIYRAKDFEIMVCGCRGDDKNGAFNIPSPIDKALMLVVASDGDGWDHVSVSRKNRCPNWIEMEYIKRLFFEDNETVMQLHVPVCDHIDNCKTALHMWRPQNIEIPKPPKYMV